MHKAKRDAQFKRLDDGLMFNSICRACRTCLCCGPHASECPQRCIVDMTHGPSCEWNGTFLSKKYCYCSIKY